MRLLSGIPRVGTSLAASSVRFVQPAPSPSKASCRSRNNCYVFNSYLCILDEGYGLFLPLKPPADAFSPQQQAHAAGRPAPSLVARAAPQADQTARTGLTECAPAARRLLRHRPARGAPGQRWANGETRPLRPACGSVPRAELWKQGLRDSNTVHANGCGAGSPARASAAAP